MPSPAAFALALLTGPAAAQTLVNAGFEEPGSPPPGWSATHGAGRPDGAASAVAADGGDAREGERSLLLAGDASTASWRYVSQAVDLAPGLRVVLRAAVRPEDVRQERGQYANAYARIGFLDAAGARLGGEITPMLTGTRGWSEVVLEGVAPEGTRRLEVAFFLSMSGALRVDDVRLAVEPTAPFSSEDVRGAAFDALERYLRRTYPFFGHRGRPDADALFAGHRERAVRQTTPTAFAGALVAMLSALDDLHVHVRVGDAVLPTHARGAHPVNWNRDAVRARVAEVVSEGPTHLVARLAEGIGYVRLDAFSAEREELEAADLAMDGLGDARAWILDVRANGGGAEVEAQRFAARFVEAPVPYARHVVRDPLAPDDPAAFGPPGTRMLQPRPGRAADPRPVAVLMGPWCVSSTEGFLMMMDAVPSATLVGLPSRGASGNPAPFVVVPGVEVVASRWRSLTLDGDCIEGAGVQPDVVVDAPAEAYAAGDPTLERALALLAE